MTRNQTEENTGNEEKYLEVQFVQVVRKAVTVKLNPRLNAHEAERDAIDRASGKIHDEVIEADGDWSAGSVRYL